MMDWDGNGSHDWNDDALFHNVINKPDSDSNSNTPQSGGCGCLGWVLGILVLLLIIGKLIG